MKNLGSAYVNLLKTSIGSGVLNFPMLCRTYGMGLTLVLTVISGLFAATGLNLLVICSESIGRSADLSKLASITIPYARIFVDIAVFLKCFGVCVSYLIITNNILPDVIANISNSKTFTYPPFSLCLFLFCVGPFCYLRKMDALKYTSLLGLISIIFVIIASVIRFHNTSSYDLPEIVYIATKPTISWLGGLGRFIFSFTCHQNIFQVYSELEDNSPRRMKKLITATAMSSFLLYVFFGGYNYLLYGNATKDNVLMNYPEDSLCIIVKWLYVLVLGVSFPLQMSPAKSYFLNIFKLSKTSKHYDLISQVVLTSFIVIGYLIAISGIKLGIVYAVIGATASTFMCLILPALFYLNMDVEKTMTLTIVAYLAFLYGVVVFLTTMISIICGFFPSH